MLLSALIRRRSSVRSPGVPPLRSILLRPAVAVLFVAPAVVSEGPVPPVVGSPTPLPLLPPPPTPSDYLARDLFPGPVGGRLSPFLSAWQTITKDLFILSVVAHGFQISISPDFPRVLRKTTLTLWDPSAHLRVLEEILSLILKRAIVQVVDSPSLSLSPIFVIPKRTGGLRVILNLKAINVFIPPSTFVWRLFLPFSPPFLHRIGWFQSTSRMLIFTFRFILRPVIFSVFSTRVAPFSIRSFPSASRTPLECSPVWSPPSWGIFVVAGFVSTITWTTG